MRWSRAGISCCLWAGLISLYAQTASSSAGPSQGFGTVSFTHQPFGASTSKWQIVAFDTGSGFYMTFDKPEPDKRPLQLSAGTLQRFAAAEAVARTRQCETRSKNVAQTGMKRLVFGMGPAAEECDFNYSDSDAVNDAAAVFQAVAETLHMGDKLAHDKRFDHLGLNADLEILTAEAKAGRALELGNIAEVLRSIAGNEDLMDVVRRRAQSLLQDASLGAAK